MRRFYKIPLNLIRPGLTNHAVLDGLFSRTGTLLAAEPLNAPLHQPM